MNEEKWMKAAIQQAKTAQECNEVPIGCVIVKKGKLISYGYNRREQLQVSTAHAEIMAIETACRILGTWRLEDCELYVTVEPCPMCTGAIIQSRIKKVVYGTKDPKGGCLGSCINLLEVRGFNHYPELIGGICSEECAKLLSDFFKEKRQKK